VLNVCVVTNNRLVCLGIITDLLYTDPNSILGFFNTILFYLNLTLTIRTCCIYLLLTFVVPLPTTIFVITFKPYHISSSSKDNYLNVWFLRSFYINLTLSRCLLNISFLIFFHTLIILSSQFIYSLWW